MLKTSVEVLTTVVRAQNDTSKTANITDNIFDRTYWQFSRYLVLLGVGLHIHQRTKFLFLPRLVSEIWESKI